LLLLDLLLLQGFQGGGLAIIQAAAAALNNITLTDNTATLAGGGAALLQAGSVTWSNSLLLRNAAPLGGGLVADGSSLLLTGVKFGGNSAAAEEDATQLLGSFAQLDSIVHLSGSAGAALLQRCSVQLHSCSFDSNTANQNAGALLVHQTAELSLVNTSLTNNTAVQGAGGALTVTGSAAARPAAAAVNTLSSVQQTAAAVSLQDCRFISNAAPAGSGGAAVFDSQLGSLTVSCKSCKFAGNSGSGDGGGAAVYGQTMFDCTDCSAESNTAGHSGGWVFCSGCSNMSLTGGRSIDNTAGAAGGAVACNGCAAFSGLQGSYSRNAAAAGGAVAVQSAVTVVLDSCGFEGNAATRASAAAAADAAGGFPASAVSHLRLADALPVQWQLLYGIGSAAAAATSADCSAAGSGGAVCISSTAAARLEGCSWQNNRAATGGAVFAAAACSSDASDSRGCLISMSVDSAVGNSADEAGGVLYTSTPSAIQLHSSSSSTSDVLPGLLQQLAGDNSVGAGGYGPGAASFPAQLSLITPEQSGQQQQVGMMVQQLGRHGRRLLQRQQQQQGSAALFTQAQTDGGSRAAVASGLHKASAAFADSAAEGRRRGGTVMRHDLFWLAVVFLILACRHTDRPFLPSRERRSETRLIF
jgi:hypothetical protein